MKVQIEKENVIVSSAFRMMLDSTNDMMFVKDANLVYVAASKAFVKMVGKESEEEIVGRTDCEIFVDKNLAKRYITDDRRLLKSGKSLVDYPEPITDDNGEARYGITSKYILTAPSGENIGIFGVTRDITKEYMMRQHYQHELKYLFRLPEDVYAVSYIDVEDWRVIGQRGQKIDKCVVETSHTVEAMTKVANKAIVDKECDAAAFYRQLTSETLKDIYMNGATELEFQYKRNFGKNMVKWVQNEIRFMVDVDSGHLCAMFSVKDIDEKQHAEQRLREAARTDRMTKLLNRETTMESIRQTLSKEKNHQHALFIIDVDNFKSLNDTLGHQTGDEFLVSLAEVLKKSFRESDIVGRVGGDEFFALMRNISEFSVTMQKAQELLANIDEVCANYPHVNLSGSIGISVYPENGKTLNELYAQSDSALYQAKREGKNQYVFA